MSFTGLVGYCWASAPTHSTMEMSPSATPTSLCTPSSSNDVAGKVYPNRRGRLVLACPGRWNNNLLSDVRCHVLSARRRSASWADRPQRRFRTARHLIIITSRGAPEDESIHIDHHRFGCLDAISLTGHRARSRFDGRHPG